MTINVDLWFSVRWPADAAAAGAPEAFLSLAALGDMNVRPEPSAHVRTALEGLGIEYDQFYWLDQDHTRIVFNVDNDSGGRDGSRDAYGMRVSSRDVRGMRGDGMITADKRTRLGVTAADCMPVYLWDTATGARGLCHSGWKGTGIAARAVEMMRSDFGSRPENIAAVLGPSIRGCCYAVPEERAAAFAEKFGAETVERRGGQWYMDLAAANRGVLASAGVRRVHTHPECTCCDTAFPGGSRFSSYRRQGGDHFTRMLAVI